MRQTSQPNLPHLIAPSSQSKIRPHTGKIGEAYKDSTPNFPQPVKAAKHSPNVLLLILLNDVGSGMCSTLGGRVQTTNMGKLANNGLKYARFHTTTGRIKKVSIAIN